MVYLIVRAFNCLFWTDEIVSKNICFKISRCRYIIIILLLSSTNVDCSYYNHNLKFRMFNSSKRNKISKPYYMINIWLFEYYIIYFYSISLIMRTRKHLDFLKLYTYSLIYDNIISGVQEFFSAHHGTWINIEYINYTKMFKYYIV